MAKAPKTTSTAAIVYKSNSLIEASYRLTVAEQRIILACICQVRHDEPVTDEVMYSVSATDIATAADISSQVAYRDLKEAALRLKRREVRVIQEPNGGQRRAKVLITGWVQTIAYVDDEGRVELRFSKDMLPYLTELTRQFTKYKLAAVVKMDSSYAIRLYELLVQWRDGGEREVEVQWLRQAFQLDDKYPAIKDLKKWVIEPAVAQINEHSDLQVSWTQRKTGRRVTHLLFKFKTKPGQKGRKRQRVEGGQRIHGIPKATIERLARPGETYEQAAARIRQEGLT